MRITLAECADRESWNTFVQARVEARFCQLHEYGEVLRCYGYRPVRLAFLADGAIVGVLPAALAKSLLFGTRLVSQPFSEYGGLLVDESLDPEAIDQIIDLAEEHFRTRRAARAMELHGNRGIPTDLRERIFAGQNRHETAILALDRPVEEIWSRVVDYSVRKGVNKARKLGVEAVEECDERIIRERFFPLYLKSMKRLGVPPHSIEYYLECHRQFGASMKIFWARREGEFIAGLLGFACGRRVNIINTVSTPEAWRFGPNDLIHWEFIAWAARNGFAYFDFGSVRYDGQRTFKKKWGTTFQDYAYYVLCRDRAKAATATFSSSSATMTRMSKLWAAHVPDRLAELAGPFARKHLVR